MQSQAKSSESQVQVTIMKIIEARTFDRESIETIFVTIGLQLQTVDRSPTFDLEFDLEGVRQGQNEVGMDPI